MKKILGVIILGLLLNGCSTTSSNMEKGKIKIGMTKYEFCLAVNSFKFSQDPCKGTFMEGYNNEARGIYYPKTKREIMHDLKKEYFFVFENVNRPFDYSTLKEGDGTIVKIFRNFDEAKTYASNIDFEIKEDNAQKAKQECTDLLLKPDTEEFADCTLKKILELSQ